MTFDCGIIPENGGLFVNSREGVIHVERRLKSHELIFIRKGTLGMWEDGQELRVKAGQTLILHAGRLHKGLDIYPVDLSFYWIHFRLRRNATLGRRVPKIAAPARPERLAELFHRFIDDQEAGTLNDTRAGLLIALMLCELNDQRDPTLTSAAGDSVLVARVEAFIDANFARPISTADAAAELGFNADYLGRVVRRDRGKTIVELLHRRRLREARVLLRDTTLSVKQIAQRCGFGHPVFLRQLFARHEGMSPREYRKLYARQHVNVR